MFGPFVFGFQDSGCADRRGRWNWDFSSDWGGPQRGRGHWRGRAARLFEQGDLKYVILRLLEEKPRHGYEIIIRQPEHAISKAKNLSNQTWQHQQEVPNGRFMRVWR